MTSAEFTAPSGFTLFDPDGAVPAFRAPRAAELLAYWQSLRGARAMPSRADFDPLAIPALLPYLMLTDLVGDPPRARYRLVGTIVAELAKFDFTGQFADALTFQDAEVFDYGACYRAVAAARRPGIGVSSWLVGDLKTRWIEFVICPLSDDGVTVDRCVALEDYEPLDLVEKDSLIPVTRR
jgi:hypothetical protein